MDQNKVQTIFRNLNDFILYDYTSKLKQRFYKSNKPMKKPLSF